MCVGFVCNVLINFSLTRGLALVAYDRTSHRRSPAFACVAGRRLRRHRRLVHHAPPRLHVDVSDLRERQAAGGHRHAAVARCRLHARVVVGVALRARITDHVHLICKQKKKT